MNLSATADAAVAAGMAPAQVAKLRQAAQDFEAMALGQLLQPIFATVDMAHGAFGGGAAEEAMQPMLVDALAKNIAAHGGLGLAEPVFASMLRSQEAASRAAAGGGR
jgi:peptidoglycan hydrolase FlgJ